MKAQSNQLPQKIYQKIPLFILFIVLLYIYSFMASNNILAQSCNSDSDCGGGICCGYCDCCTAWGDCDPDSSGCFIAGTQISTDKNSTIDIEQLQKGDRVLSFDEQSSQVTTSQVTNLYQVQRDYYYQLDTSSGDSVQVTAEHPFFIGYPEPRQQTPFYHLLNGFASLLEPFSINPSETLSGYQTAERLRVGDQVYIYKDDQLTPAQITSKQKIDQPTTAYNLSVSDSENFIAQGFAVHNKSYGQYGGYVYCQDPGGPLYPMPSVTVEYHISRKDYGWWNGARVTDANGYSDTGSINTHDSKTNSNNVFIRMSSLAGKTLSNGVPYTNLIPADNAGIADHATNCSTDWCRCGYRDQPCPYAGWTGCRDDDPYSFGATEQNYVCGTRDSVGDHYDFRFVGCSPPTPTPTPIPSRTYTVTATPFCANGFNPSVSTILFWSVWPPNPLTWHYDTYSMGSHTHTETINSPTLSNLYIGLLSPAGWSEALQPTGSPPHPQIEYAQKFSPPT
jgi:hypothetical protein